MLVYNKSINFIKKDDHCVRTHEFILLNTYTLYCTSQSLYRDRQDKGRTNCNRPTIAICPLVQWEYIQDRSSYDYLVTWPTFTVSPFVRLAQNRYNLHNIGIAAIIPRVGIEPSTIIFNQMHIPHRLLTAVLTSNRSL